MSNIGGYAQNSKVEKPPYGRLGHLGLAHKINIGESRDKELVLQLHQPVMRPEAFIPI